MSVKLMTVKQIRDDLKTIALTWPEGVPWEQLDRVKALKGELKRRSEGLENPAASQDAEEFPPVELLGDETLATELRALSTRNDEAAQRRFADVRFEIRKRAKADEAARQPTVSPVLARALELPSDDEMPPELVDELRARAAGAPLRYKAEGEDRTPRPKPVERLYDDDQRKAVPAPITVCGFTAAPDGAGVTLVYVGDVDGGRVQIIRRMTIADTVALVAMLRAARAKFVE